MRRFIIQLALSIIGVNSYAQDTLNHSFLSNSAEFNPKRTAFVLGTEMICYSGTMWALGNLWYKDYPKSRFHWFNDNQEWLQMDKIGHATTAYYIGKAGMDVLKWSGVPERKSIICGGLLGFAFLTSVEVFDGYSAAWGASSGDLIANFAGAALLIGQELAWGEQRLLLKFSAHPSPYAQYRPNALGESWNERILKDYNGQTYWLSVNLASFTGSDTYIPKWFNLAVGYSADGMTGGSENHTINSEGQPIPEFDRQRQFLLSIDVDLTKIKTKHQWVNSLLGTIGFIKVPMPTYEYGTKTGLRGHMLYF